MEAETTGRVLVVEDDPQVRELFTVYLSDRYEVETAASGEEALSTVSEDVDVILLDRKMPGYSGDDVLREIREKGVDCRVAMVTAFQPELDIIDLGFDDYVIKPVSEPELHNVVDSLLNWGQYDSIVRQYLNVAKRVAVFEEGYDESTLTQNDEYQHLLDELETLRTESRKTAEALETGDIEDDLTAIEDELDSTVSSEQ